MNSDIFAGNWKQMKGQVRERWGKFTDDDLDVIEGRREQIVGKIQERYGIAQDEAEKQLKAFEKNYNDRVTTKDRTRTAGGY